MLDQVAEDNAASDGVKETERTQWQVIASVAPKIGFVTHQNSVPIIHTLGIEAPSDKDWLSGEGALRDLTLTLSADPPFIETKTWCIDSMSAGDSLNVADRDVVLNAGMLHDLSENMVGTARLVLTDAKGDVLADRRYAIELLAYNHWGGIASMAELLAGFVMPNDPAVDRVLKGASDVLRRAGKPDGIDGYEAKDRRRVWEVASAIWSSVAGLRLSYALPPASFEQSGQKIRTPSQILEGKVATCLDTALLFAAALEQAQLNPLIVITQGHAFVGVWLQSVEFATLITDEAAALRRRTDINDLVLFETTLVTQNPPVRFNNAITSARRQIDEDSEATFEMAIDVRRARMQKLRPLGMVHALARNVGDATDASRERLVEEGMENAPVLPPVDVENEEIAQTPAGRIVQWQRKLLNLTTSNNLLNMKDSKSVVRLLCPDPAQLEDILSAGRKVRIVPMPEIEVGGRDEKIHQQRSQSSLRDEIAEAALKRGEALSILSKAKLDGALIELYRKARSDMEEGGANTLYIALGFLKWKKSPTEERTYRAPLILLPIRLERKSARSGMSMTAHEDEARFNLTLLELLRQDFELTIPGVEGDLPQDGSGIDVAGIWRTVRSAVRDMAGFEVVPDVAMGTFSFAKYLMWKDLVDRADRLKESPLVRHLIERDGSVAAGDGDFPAASGMDDRVDPASLFAPLPADSSQLVAVLASSQGRHFVLDGPPGTGKSQTIANMIAHNLALGRRVLFVAEKRAALEVVQRRLADKGLAPFCLELHSAKATKSAVLKQLDSAWTARETLTEQQWEREAAELKRLRDDLNAVVKVLHRMEPNGWTIHRAIGHTVREADMVVPVFSFPGKPQHDGEDMARMRDIVRRLGIARKEVADLPPTMNGVWATQWSNGWQEDIVAVAAQVPEALDAVTTAHAALIKATHLPLDGDGRADMAGLLALTDQCLALHGQDMRFAFAPNMADMVTAVREAIKLRDRYRAEESALSSEYAAEVARRINTDAMQAEWSEAGQKFWFLATLAQRRLARSLAQTGGASGPVDPEEDLPRLAVMGDLLEQMDALAPLASGVPGWAGLATDSVKVERAIVQAEKLRASIAAEADSPERLAEMRRAVSTLVIDANDMLSADGQIAGAAERLRRMLARLDEIGGRFSDLCASSFGGDVKAMRDCALVVVGNGRRLHGWAAWRRVRDEAIGANLMPLVGALEKEGVSPDNAAAAFETAYARWFALTRMDDEPLLKNFMGGEQEDRIARFRKLDDEMGELASRYIRAKLCGGIPDKESVGKKDGYGVLRHQLQLQRPSKPIRQLAADMGDAFDRLAPCMLMSPLSIAQYLPTDQALFDLVIFDEASQITPWDAIGAMARGKQVVIAGDPRQMPPSNDFQRGSGTESMDDDTMPDMESILDECLAAGVPQHSLDWHYRSRHESLITFSNHKYYSGKLVTFPPPKTRASAVAWRRVEGVYTSGARTNPIEAQAVVDEAVRYLRDPAFIDEKGKPLTLGIITMNTEQMRLVEDLLEKARRAWPEIEPHFDDARLEPLCVRNLETAQGDERDVMLLSVGFGPTEPGGKNMSMFMGKLNRDGGWRRLNVAVTRARREMKIFTSFDPGMIDPNRTSAEGVRDLKAFIEFAGRGPRALAEAVKGSMGGPDSPFEEGVAMALRRRGWTIVPQVGVSSFRIDLGIVHPDRPGDYLLGVECDGASYHSAATARDRDKVRAAILEGLGWKLLRIWSTDWWIDKERAADRLHMAMEAYLAEDRQKAADMSPDTEQVAEVASCNAEFSSNREGV